MLPIDHTMLQVIEALNDKPDHNPEHQRHRLARAKHQEEINVYTHLHGHEPHIEALNRQRLQEAVMAEQIRLARAGHQGRVTTAANSIRSAIGTMLISAGERIRYEPAPNPELDNDLVDTAMSA